ncbi:helix-turn-helix domain-containing protein [Primorskyibacter sp. 2E233]|uniref:helix-turn-helix domain-containing protein n=1 Tax=Primorskyibacter sp. 2E233 TaxID=3413431 RepID=UPI003BF33B7B
MAGTQHTKQYRDLIEALVGLRHEKGLSQTQLARLLSRNRSYVAKVELCERRLDILECWEWIGVLDDDPALFLKRQIGDLRSDPSPIEIETDNRGN